MLWVVVMLPQLQDAMYLLQTGLTPAKLEQGIRSIEQTRRVRASVPMFRVFTATTDMQMVELIKDAEARTR
jgi:hypothetical protein